MVRNFLSFLFTNYERSWVWELANASITESAHITAALEGMFRGKADSFLPFLTFITISKLFRETGWHSQLDGQPQIVKSISLIILFL